MKWKLFLLPIPVLFFAIITCVQLKYPSFGLSGLSGIISIFWISASLISFSLLIILAAFKNKLYIVVKIIYICLTCIPICLSLIISVGYEVDYISYLYPFVSYTDNADNYLKTDVYVYAQKGEINDFFPDIKELENKENLSYNYYYDKVYDELYILLRYSQEKTNNELNRYRMDKEFTYYSSNGKKIFKRDDGFKTIRQVTIFPDDTVEYVYCYNCVHDSVFYDT